MKVKGVKSSLSAHAGLLMTSVTRRLEELTLLQAPYCRLMLVASDTGSLIELTS